MAEIVITAVGVAMEEALIVRWLKEPGDPVAVDEPVVEIDTDKATMEVVSPTEGTLGPHLVEPGTVVAVGTVIVHVLDDSGADDSSNGQSTPAVAGAATTASPVPAGDAETVASEAGEEGEAGEAGVATGPERTAHRLSPRARRLAAAATTAAAPAQEVDRDARFRALIAGKVAESWREIPHFTVSRAVDAEPMQARLRQLREGGGDPVATLSDLLLRALALALREGGQDGPVDVGLAVATPHGVVIPVVRDVLGQQPDALARARSEAVERARAGKLSQDDLSAQPRSTLSNLGAFGVDRFTGIVAIGQTSLLTVGRARPCVVAGEGGEIEVRSMFDATLNADHRTVDGAEAAKLLVAFATAAEGMTPDR
jgi:pyruvate/2-oxoglutarate dehydrogenase complex dihydrolipoamide acyltransferase (E2) component